jgi:hypothetical protein
MSFRFMSGPPFSFLFFSFVSFLGLLTTSSFLVLNPLTTFLFSFFFFFPFELYIY